jgi:hypothetical protein
MSTMIPDADALVTYIQSFTGSTDNQEIKECIYLTELMMRNIELPALRTNPWTTLGVADQYGNVPIPPDMNRPILFFQQGPTSNGAPSSSNGAGPWIVYDRIGDREMISEQLIQNLYLTPVNIPQVYRGKFSEIGQNYEFLPKLGEGQIVNMYYFTTWPLLFSLETDGVTEVLNNVVLQSFPEGYVYGTLHNYYYKRKMADDADKWLAKFNLAWDTIEDQNNKGKWQGGYNRMTSVFQPRRDRRYTAK